MLPNSLADKVLVASLLALGFLPGCGNMALDSDTSGQTGVTAVWSKLTGGPTAISAPSLTSQGKLDLDAFVQGSDGRIWTDYWSTQSGWVGWSPLDGIVASGPGATSWGENGGQLAVAALDSNGQVIVRTWTKDGKWTPWGNIDGGVFDKDKEPALAYRTPYLYAFAVSRRTLQWTRRNVDDPNMAEWAPWTAVPGMMLSSAPSVVAVVNSPGRIVIGGQGIDGHAWFSEMTAQKVPEFGVWNQIPGQDLMTRPALSSYNFAQLNVIVTGLDHQISMNASSDAGLAWSGWNALAGKGGTAPAAWSRDSGVVDILVGEGGDIFWTTATP